MEKFSSVLFLSVEVDVPLNFKEAHQAEVSGSGLHVFTHHPFPEWHSCTLKGREKTTVMLVVM